MDIWRLEAFKTLIGQSLTATELGGEGSCELKVLEVNESTSLGEGWESFSVILESDVPVKQGSLECSHEAHGVSVLFLTPKSENQLEAIFNYELSKIA